MNKRILVALLLLFFPWTAASAGNDPLTVLSADDQGLVLELVVTTYDTVILDYERPVYQRITIPGFGLTHEIGRPQVPVKGTLIGLPEGTEIVIEVVDSEYHVLSDMRIAPVHKPAAPEDGETPGPVEVFALDTALYDTNAFYPGDVVKRGFSGAMRDQPVAQLLFFPLQFNPVRQGVRLYTRLRVKVTFEPVARKGTVLKSRKPNVVQPSSLMNPYEDLMRRTIINYPTLKR